MALEEFLSFLSGFFVVLPLLFTLGGVFWAFQFVQLMALSQEDFPSRNDKLLWLIAFVVANVFAALAFWHWRRVMLEMRAAEREANHNQHGKSTT